MSERTKTYYAKHAAELAEYGVGWRAANRVERKAHYKVAYAIKIGSLVRPANCEKCFKASKIQAHHEDYSKPLEVMWLCQSCHRKQHGFVLRNPTVLKGSLVGNSKLNEEKVREIKKLIEKRIPNPIIAAQFGCSKSNISLIARKKAWNHI